MFHSQTLHAPQRDIFGQQRLDWPFRTYRKVSTNYKRLGIYSGISAIGTYMTRYLRKRGAGPYNRRRGYAMGSSFKRRKMTHGRRRKGISSGRGLTFEHDRQFMYRKKRMPRRKKRRWLRFGRKVRAVADGTLGTRTVLFNSQKQYTLSSANQQLSKNFTLYGWSSNDTNQPWHNDIAYIMNLENTGNPTAAAGVTQGKDTKVLFKSGVLDLTIRNTSYQTDTPSTIVAEATAEVDLYEWVMGREAELDGVNIGTGTTVFKTNDYAQTEYAITDNNAVPSTTIVDLENRGATPFDCTAPLGDFRIKILKKTKFFIRGGQTITYQIRDPKNRTLDRKDLKQTTVGQGGFNLPRVTRNILLVGKLVPGFTLGAGSNMTLSMDAGVTRKYSYKVRGAPEQRSLYINN